VALSKALEVNQPNKKNTHLAGRLLFSLIHVLLKQTSSLQAVEVMKPGVL